MFVVVVVFNGLGRNSHLYVCLVFGETARESERRCRMDWKKQLYCLGGWVEYSNPHGKRETVAKKRTNKELSAHHR